MLKNLETKKTNNRHKVDRFSLEFASVLRSQIKFYVSIWLKLMHFRQMLGSGSEWYTIFYGRKWRAWPIQLIVWFLVNLPKWHFLTQLQSCMGFGFFWAKWLYLKSLVNFIQKVPLALSKWLFRWVKVDK